MPHSAFFLALSAFVCYPFSVGPKGLFLLGKTKPQKYMGLVSFVRDSVAEMKHVSWPTRRQVIAYTVLVIVVSAVIASYLGTLDVAFTWLLEKVLFGNQ